MAYFRIQNRYGDKEETLHVILWLDGVDILTGLRKTNTFTLRRILIAVFRMKTKSLYLHLLDLIQQKPLKS